MNIYATQKAKEVWNDSLRSRERARTLAATWFAPSALAPTGLESDRDGEYKKRAIDAIVSAAELKEYPGHWQQLIAQLPADNCRKIDATLQTRLLVNLSGSILENAGISLEYCCGVPVIPGSAVKGAARRYAIALMQESDEARKEELLDLFINIFGCAEVDFEKGSDLALAIDAGLLTEMGELYGKRRGQVCFLQAVPKEGVQLCADVLTPHHKAYMEGKIEEATDDEEPSPSYFPAVEPGKKAIYSFVLYAPGHPELLDTAEEWLSKAIALFGIGAKGAAGYGYFSVPDKALQEYSEEQNEAIRFISEKKKLTDMLKTFAKGKDKEPLKHWALLRAIALPESDPKCRLQDFREYLTKETTDKKEIKARQKSLEAMQQMAASYNINLPDIQ